jgi:O-antigen ligase
MYPPQNERHYLYYFNSLAVFWFFAFLIVGPKYSLASTALLLLSLTTLPSKCAQALAALRTQMPWVLGITVYCIFHIAYRYFEGLPLDELDPPFRYLAAIPIVIYLQIHGFSRTALGLGLAVGCLIGGGAGIYEVVSGQAVRAGMKAAHHPIPYGTLVTVMAVCAIYHATIARNLALQSLIALGAIVGFVAAFYSGTRGLYPAILLALSYLGYRKLRAIGVNRRSVVVALSALILTACFGAYQLPTVQERIAATAHELRKIESGNLNTSIGQRLQMWHTALYLFRRNPVFGTGFDKKARSAQAAPFLAAHGYQKKLLDLYDHFHNEYLHALAAYGLTGFLALMALLSGAVRGLPDNGRPAATAILIVIAVEALTEAIFIDTKLTTGFIFLVTVLRAQALWQTRTPEESFPS